MSTLLLISNCFVFWTIFPSHTFNLVIFWGGFHITYFFGDHNRFRHKAIVCVCVSVSESNELVCSNSFCSNKYIQSAQIFEQKRDNWIKVATKTSRNACICFYSARYWANTHALTKYAFLSNRSKSHGYDEPKFDQVCCLCVWHLKSSVFRRHVYMKSTGTWWLMTLQQNKNIWKKKVQHTYSQRSIHYEYDIMMCAKYHDIPIIINKSSVVFDLFVSFCHTALHIRCIIIKLLFSSTWECKQIILYDYCVVATHIFIWLGRSPVHSSLDSMKVPDSVKMIRF